MKKIRNTNFYTFTALAIFFGLDTDALTFFFAGPELEASDFRFGASSHHAILTFAVISRSVIPWNSALCSCKKRWRNFIYGVGALLADFGRVPGDFERLRFFRFDAKRFNPSFL